MKKIYIFLLELILILFISSCNKYGTCKDFYSCYKKYGGSSYNLEENNVFKELSLDDLYNKIENSESFILYYGQPECSTCVKCVPYINLIAKEKNISEILYLKSKIYTSINADSERIDTMQVKIGFDDKNSPNSTPRLWCFINGMYEKGMANYAEKDSKWEDVITKLIDYYIKRVEEIKSV